jgi:hypothetical protein
MIFTKHRFEIWNQAQHPYKHQLGDFAYTNPALPGVTNTEGALNWILAVLYPQTMPAVANVAALPAVGNTINDFRVVQDDGDGKAAAYRWELREGEVSASWHKIYDMDWGADAILEAFQTRTQDLYVFRRGYDDLDAAGAVVAGLYAGQVITGGLAASSNLTLRANGGDGTGARTGFVQVDDQFRPAVHNTFDLGTTTFRWKDIYAQSSAVIGTLSIVSGSITDTSGAISFDNENLTTTGNITGAVVKGTTSVVIEVAGQTATLVPGSYTDTTGTVSFGATNLGTSGTLGAGVATFTDNAQTVVIDPDAAGVGRITSSTGTLSFDNENLVTTGTLDAGNATVTRLDSDNIRIDGNTVSVLNTNGNLILQANGTGVIDLQNSVTSLDQTITGTLGVTGQLNIDNIRVDGNTISSTNLNGNVNIHPNGTGHVNINANIHPNNDNTRDLGESANRWNDLFLGGVIDNGTNNISIATLLGLRSSQYRDLGQTLPAQAGDTLFYDAVNSVWIANHPDTEITHSELSGLTTGDAGHTQFAVLAGRVGGQTLQGGTAASENLTLESTAHGTKGDVLTKDDLLPFTNASYSGGWSGTDLGGSSNYFRDLYTRGELKGARLENYTFATLPAASAQNIGRVVYATDLNKAYVDTGTTFKVLGVSKFQADQVFDGVILLLNVDVSADITDARNAIWQLKDNANNFEVMNVTLLATSASNVRITTNVALPAGSYRLIGLE